MNRQLKKVLQVFETAIKYANSIDHDALVDRLERNLIYLQNQKHTSCVTDRRIINELLNTIVIHRSHGSAKVVDDLLKSIDVYHKRDGFNLYTELNEHLGLEEV